MSSNSISWKPIRSSVRWKPTECCYAITIAISGRSYRVKDAALGGTETKKKRPAEAQTVAPKKSGEEKE